MVAKEHFVEARVARAAGATVRQWKERRGAGLYQTDYGKFPKIQILTIEDLFAGKKPQMPWLDPTAFKKAAQEDMNAGKQEKLL
ncbi:MAG: hypothetical protein P9F19_15820 [Candidatus Contendobacter sp.]|nr:hypothetical protein [Candidatus Contendobacter sp.]MDG4558839.1 hypothetical protein [Candidatus Contendobacter sp.]